MLDRIRNAASEVVSTIYDEDVSDLLTQYFQVAAVMGPTEAAPPTESSHHSGSRSGEEPSTRAKPETNNTKDKGGNMQRQPGRDATADNHMYSREMPKPKTASGSVVTDLQKKLEQRQGELEVQFVRNARLIERHLKLRQTKKEQDEIIKDQAEKIKARDDLINTILYSHVEPYAKKNGLHCDEWTEDLLLDVLTSLARDAADAGSNAVKIISLTEKVSMLQKEMLAKVEKVHVASDEQFAQDFRAIASSVKSLSRIICINDAVDAPKILSAGFLLDNVPRHHWTGRARKKLLVEAWVWSVLMDFIFRTPFAIFGEQCDILNANWQSLYMVKHCHGWPTPTSSSEIWRCTTVESVLDLVDPAVISDGKVQQVPQKLAPSIITARTKVYNTIGACLSKISTKPVDPVLVQSLVNKAFAFALEMSRQRVRLQVTFPVVGEKFNSDTMKFKSDTDEDVHDNAVAFIINPGLSKWGDTHGKNFDHRYDIVTSLVHLETVPQQEVMLPKPASQVWADVAKREVEGASTSDRNNKGESQR
jgi:hypothetical protein